MGWVQVADVDNIYYYNKAINRIKLYYKQNDNCNNKNNEIENRNEF